MTGKWNIFLISNTKFATTVNLVVEIVFFQQFVAPFLQSVFAPVLCPEMHGLVDGAVRRIFVHHLFCTLSGGVHLVQILPT